MSSLPATLKGAATRETIVDQAYAMACSSGLEGLSIGPLAQAVGMSKSGVFAHFGSREELQLAVLDSAARRFGEAVLVAAIAEPRGLPRLRAIMHNWFEWVRNTAGGCVLLGAVSEYDDREGPVRDRLLDGVLRWRSALKRTVIQAIDAGHLEPETDADQLVFEMDALFTGLMRDARFLNDQRAPDRAWAAWQRLLQASLAEPAALSVPISRSR